MIHPLFAGFDEGHNMQRVAEALGFDSRFRTMDLEDMGDSEQEAYDRDGMKFIDAWAPEVPDGFELAGKWDHEDGPVAMFVRPTTALAVTLWSVGGGAGVPLFWRGDDGGDVRAVPGYIAAYPAAAGAAVEAIYNERLRQVNAEGWSHEHDDKHDDGELMGAAACYVLAAVLQNAGLHAHRSPPECWPWAAEWWKPKGGARRNLEKAGALLLAEIERIDRASLRAEGGA